MQSVIHTTFGQANLSRKRDDGMKGIDVRVCDKILVPGTAHEELLRIIENSQISKLHSLLDIYMYIYTFSEMVALF